MKDRKRVDGQVVVSNPGCYECVLCSLDKMPTPTKDEHPKPTQAQLGV